MKPVTQSNGKKKAQSRNINFSNSPRRRPPLRVGLPADRARRTRRRAGIAWAEALHRVDAGRVELVRAGQERRGLEGPEAHGADRLLLGAAPRGPRRRRRAAAARAAANDWCDYCRILLHMHYYTHAAYFS